MDAPFDAGRRALGAVHVGGADISAAQCADVFLAKETHQDKSKGNRAQEICNNSYDEKSRHG